MLKSARVIFVVQIFMTVSLILGISSYVDYESARERLNKSLLASIDSANARMSRSLPKAIWDFDLQAAKLAIAAELKLPDIRAIKVKDVVGNPVLFLYLPSEQIVLPKRLCPGLFLNMKRYFNWSSRWCLRNMTVLTMSVRWLPITMNPTWSCLWRGCYGVAL
ncbi:hypothetical protein [Zobellella endophytica]|uniref:hypothetical protein n=1 Tax=Zobellella endophytica TaxID=2116700 RepID=UPI0011B20464|nr:hypothetical protein [Zobellella endophytica]